MAKQIVVMAAQSQESLRDDGADFEQHSDTIKEAKATAKYILTPAYARHTEKKEPFGYSCVVVDGKILYDFFA